MKGIIATNLIGAIGLGTGLPWKCKADLQHFKKLTTGCTCLVGRKTYEYLPPLKNRELIVVGKEFLTLEEALDLEPDWVIGGKSIYEQTVHLLSELHVSIINDRTQGDTTFPDVSKFEGETFYYHFEPDASKVSNKEIKTLIEYVNSFGHYPGADELCKHDIFEQHLIKKGFSIQDARNFPRLLICKCLKCSNKLLL